MELKLQASICSSRVLLISSSAHRGGPFPLCNSCTTLTKFSSINLLRIFLSFSLCFFCFVLFCFVFHAFILPIHNTLKAQSMVLRKQRKLRNVPFRFCDTPFPVHLSFLQSRSCCNTNGVGWYRRVVVALSII